MKEKAARRNEVKDVSKVLKIFTIHHSMAFESKKSRLMSIFWWNGLWLNISEGRLYVKEERTKSKPLKFDAFNLFWPLAHKAAPAAAGIDSVWFSLLLTRLG